MRLDGVVLVFEAEGIALLRCVAEDEVVELILTAELGIGGEHVLEHLVVGRRLGRITLI